MTTFTVEIDKDKDLSALKEIAGKLGLKYHVDERDGLLYTDDLKHMLDKRYQEFKDGAVELIDAKKSQKRIWDLLESTN